MSSEAPLRPVTLEEELQRNPELRLQDVQLLRDWADKQLHLPHILDRELALFLHSCYYNVESAKVTAENYFTARTKHTEFFKQCDAALPEVQQAAEVVGYTVLPGTTPEGYRVLLCRITDKNASRFHHANATKVFNMVIDLMLLSEGTAPGLILVIDLEGVQLGHMFRLSLSAFKNFFFYLQEAMPLRLKGMHYFNIVPFTDKLIGMMRPFMKKEIYDMLHLHKNLDMLFQFVPRDVMPQDYGGTAPSFSEMHKGTLQRLLINRAHFAEEERRQVNEDLRPGRTRSGFFSFFSFRGLSLR